MVLTVLTAQCVNRVLTGC